MHIYVLVGVCTYMYYCVGYYVCKCMYLYYCVGYYVSVCTCIIVWAIM